MKPNKRSAFTLIELLVVISIISMLVSILLPSLQKARESARQIVCVTNVRGIFTASLFYVHDNDGKYPATMVSDFYGNPLDNIVKDIERYFDMEDPWTDPSQSRMPKTAGVDPDKILDGLYEQDVTVNGVETTFKWPVHYAFNRYMYPFVQPPYDHPDKLLTFTHTRESAIVRPLETLAIFCFHCPHIGWGMSLRFDRHLPP